MAENPNHSPRRHVRMTNAAWDLILRGAAIKNTSTRVILVGAITEALLRLHEAGRDIEPHLERLERVTARSIAGDSVSPSVLPLIRRRLKQHGYESTTQ